MNELREYVKRKFNLSDDDYKKLVEFEKERIANPTFDYEGLTLDEAKQLKTKELSYHCQQSILGYFESTVNGITYKFSNDTEAQKNFDKGVTVFEKGYLTTMKWTCYDSEGNVVRLDLDSATFEPVYIDHLTHIQNNISKFRDELMTQVEIAETVDEIQTIAW